MKINSRDEYINKFTLLFVQKITMTNPNTSIEWLPDEILECIFAYLPLADRVRIDRVCKRWRYRNQTWFFPQELDLISEKQVMINSVLKRCGKVVTKIMLRDVKMLHQLINTIYQHCPNLKTIEISFP